MSKKWSTGLLITCSGFNSDCVRLIVTHFLKLYKQRHKIFGVEKTKEVR